MEPTLWTLRTSHKITVSSVTPVYYSFPIFVRACDDGCMYLSLFPELLAFPLVATLVLRAVVGLFFIAYGTQSIRSASYVKRFVGIVWFATGTFLLLGLYTQGAALGATLLCFLAFFRIPVMQAGPSDRRTYLLLGVMAFTLLFYGGGIMALDLPL